MDINIYWNMLLSTVNSQISGKRLWTKGQNREFITRTKADIRTFQTLVSNKDCMFYKAKNTIWPFIENICWPSVWKKNEYHKRSSYVISPNSITSPAVFPQVLTIKQTTRANKCLSEVPILYLKWVKAFLSLLGRVHQCWRGQATRPGPRAVWEQHWVITISVMTKQLTFLQSAVLCALQTAFPRIFVIAFWGNYYYYPYPIDEESGA